MSIPPSADWAVPVYELYEAQRYSEALYAVDAVLAGHPQIANDPCHAAVAHSLRGVILSHLGWLEEAAQEQEVALALDAKNAGIWRQYGIVQSEQKRYAEALASVERALELDAHEPLILQSKAAVLIDLGRREEAIHAYDQALALAPDNAAELWTHKSEQFVELKRYEDALAAAVTALELTGGRDDAMRAWHTKGLALLGLKRYEEADEAYERAVSEHPNNLTLWERKTEVLLHLHRFRAAWAAFRKMARLRRLWDGQQRYERRLP